MERRDTGRFAFSALTIHTFEFRSSSSLVCPIHIDVNIALSELLVR